MNLIVPAVPGAAWTVVLESPVKMVVAGGIAQSVMLGGVGLGTVYLHHRHLPREVAPPSSSPSGFGGRAWSSSPPRVT